MRKYKSDLLESVRREILTRHYSLRTEGTYIYWIKRFIYFTNKRHPLDCNDSDIQHFLSWLAIEQNVSSSTQNTVFNALVFLYREVLNRPISNIQATRPKKPTKIPIVLNKQEVTALLNKLEGVYWLMAALMYGSGLRLMETMRLRVKDFDFSYKAITVRAGKGAKDRVVVLPQELIPSLKQQISFVKHQHNADLRLGYGEVVLPRFLGQSVKSVLSQLTLFPLVVESFNVIKHI